MQKNPDNTAGQKPLRDYLIEKFSLAPEVDDAAIIAAIESAITDGSTAATQLSEITAKMEAIQADLQIKQSELEALYKAKATAEVDEILKPFEARIPDEAARAAIRNVLMSDRDSGLAILNGLPGAAAPASPKVNNPPDATHEDNPTTSDEMTPADKVEKSNALIQQIRREKPSLNYESARDEARRREPNLFS